MAAQRRQAFIEAISEQDSGKYLQFLADHRSKSQPFSLDEVLVELPRSQLDTVWHSLFGWTTVTLHDILPDGEQEVQPEAIQLMNAVLDTALATVTGLQSSGGDRISVPDGLHQVVVMLNALLLSFDELPVLDATCARISRLSELWWCHGLVDAESLAPITLTYLLQLTLATDHKTTRALVCRVLALQPCLRHVSLLALSSGRLRQLLCAAAQCPTLLTWEEGVRLLAELLAERQLRAPLHAAVKAVLPTVSNHQALRYGHAYYRAWRHADEPARRELEDECLQDLMYHAVHAERHGSRLARLLYQLLHYIHGQRLHRDTAVMLVRLYQPILWRALTAPNEMAQLNATFLFLDVFPLEDPTESREARDTELARQCRLMASLLQETSHQVRAAAAKGVCKVLAQFWDVMPADCLKQMLKLLVQDLAFDAASVAVRLHVISGISVVLDNPYTHLYMQSALPLLTDAFHDTQLSVRVAMCDLLLKVKPLKNIRYFDIVPVKQLLARLAEDQPPVCSRIVQLMINSFFPANECDETLLGRCICLIQENAAASRRFYQHSAKVLSLEDAVRLMIAIRQALTIHAKRQPDRTAAAARPSTADKENSGHRLGKRRLHNVEDRSVLSDASQESASDESTAESQPAAPTSPLDKPEVVTGLVDVVAVLWTSRLAELAQQAALLQRLQSAWSRVLPLLFTCHKDSPAGDSLLYVASLLPYTPMAPLASHCVSALRQLPADASAQRCAALLDPLVNWGRCDDVLDLCTESLQAAIDGEHSFVTSQKNQRRSAAGVRFRDPHRGCRPGPRLALRWLLHLFTPSLRRPSLVAKYAGPLSELHAWMSGCVMSVAEDRLSSERPNDDRDAMVADLLRAYTVLSLVLAADGQPDRAVIALQDLLTWAHGVASSPGRWVNSALLGRICTVVTEATLSTSPTGVLSPGLAAATAGWLQLYLSGPRTDGDGCVSTLFHAADLLEAVTCRPADQLPDWQHIYTELIPQLVGSAVGQLTNLSASGDQLSPAQLTEVTSLVRGLVASWRSVGDVGESPLRDVTSLLFAAAVAHVRRDKLTGSTALPQPDLPPLTAALVSPLWRDSLGRRLLLDVLAAGLAESADEDTDQVLSQVVTSSYLLHALTASHASALRDCRPAVNAALAAAARISQDQLTGDDAPLEHLSAAKRILETLAVRCSAA